MEAERGYDENETLVHAPEPWSQEDRYVRDAFGTIVVRGRSPADARRIVAAINSTRGIPTDALEGWTAQDVSDPHTRPELEVELPEADGAAIELTAPAFPEFSLTSGPPASPPPERASFLFERRLFQRRMGPMPVPRERRTVDRRRLTRQDGAGA